MKVSLAEPPSSTTRNRYDRELRDLESLGHEQRNRIGRRLFVNLEAVIEAVSGRPEIRTNAAAAEWNSPSPARCRARRRRGSSRQTSRRSRARILRERHFAENHELAIGRVELPLRQQVRPAFHVSMCSSSFGNPSCNCPRSTTTSPRVFHRSEFNVLPRTYRAVSARRQQVQADRARSPTPRPRFPGAENLDCRCQRAEFVCVQDVLRDREPFDHDGSGARPFEGDEILVAAKQRAAIDRLLHRRILGERHFERDIQPSSRISRRYRVSGCGREKPLQEMFVCSRSASYFVPASSKPSPESESAINRQRTVRASMSCHGVPGLLCESALRVRMATEAFSAS